ncbi:MAG TPA: RsmE family RNA methyltransferase [Hanamia sp.]|nr:RsmE family RNA methyltransferase [Hanamia sp.]
MTSPYFFEETLPVSDEFTLSEETSRHISQVLRMKEGEEIVITNGEGYRLFANILCADKKKTKIKITRKEFLERPIPRTAIAISLIKNNNRFEWFAEKATEIGISEIIPLICKRSEKTHFKMERTRSILISAMLQSQQSWLPELSEPVKISEVIKKENYEQKFIAHCVNDEKKELKSLVSDSASKIILIGPEGDFTEEEIQTAIQQNYIPVSLGETRLRTETAGIAAAILLK